VRLRAPPGWQCSTIFLIGVIGAGTMGNGIAQVCAGRAAGHDGRCLGPDAIQRGIKTLSGSLERLVKPRTS
jgi:3-hydroxybutyryl-CoA dehydrogenase